MSKAPKDDASKPAGPCVSRIELKDLKEAAFPGRLPRDELRVALSPGAHAAMRTHAKSSLDREVCGVMLGQVRKDAQGPFLAIDDVIEGQNSQGSEAKVTFTPDAWNHIFAEQGKRDPNLKMVGWYHTHPRFGIFLSSYDQFIHQNFFGVEPWMVAYVVDPVADEEGFFFWSQGKTRRVPRYWIGEKPRASDGAEFEGRELADDHASRAAPPPTSMQTARQTQARAPEAAPAVDGAPWWKDPIALVTIALCGLVLAVVFFMSWSSSSARDAELRRMQEDVHGIYMAIYHVDADVRQLRERAGLPQSPRSAEIDAYLLGLIRKLEREVARTGGEQPPPASLPPDAPRPPAPQGPQGPAPAPPAPPVTAPPTPPQPTPPPAQGPPLQPPPPPDPQSAPVEPAPPAPPPAEAQAPVEPAPPPASGDGSGS